MRILIDPGHGGKDPGATGNGLIEKDLTMFLALRVEERLDKYDCEAEIFQLPNVTAQEDLQSVVDAANETGADFFLSLHINSAADPAASGFESFRYPGDSDSEKYQAAIHAAVMEYLAGHGVPNRKMKEADYKVLRETKMPAVLLECCFLSSPTDAQRLKDIRFLDKLANAITWGLVQALGLQPKAALASDAAAEIKKLKDILDQRDVELAAARDRYMAAETEIRRLRQVIDKAGGILAAEMHR